MSSGAESTIISNIHYSWPGGQKIVKLTFFFDQTSVLLSFTLIRLALVCTPWPEKWVCYHFSSDRWRALLSNWCRIPRPYSAPSNAANEREQAWKQGSMFWAVCRRTSCSSLTGCCPLCTAPTALLRLSGWPQAWGCGCSYNHLLSLSNQHLSHWHWEPL